MENRFSKIKIAQVNLALLKHCGINRIFFNADGYPAVNQWAFTGKHGIMQLGRAILFLRGFNIKDKCADHINGNILDNRISNLRLTNRTGNAANNRPRNGRKTKGIRKHGSRKYEARIGSGGTYLGMFSTKSLAIKAYNSAAIKKYGRFASLNKERK